MSICILDTAAVITLSFSMLAKTPSDKYCALLAFSPGGLYSTVPAELSPSNQCQVAAVLG